MNQSAVVEILRDFNIATKKKQKSIKYVDVNYTPRTF